jgi:Spy/CpxP family protein refolding chaperone
VLYRVCSLQSAAAIMGGKPVRKPIVYVAVVCLIAASAFTWASAQQTVPASTAAAKPNVDEVLKSVRADLQGSRADIVAKNVTLTAEQAAKFWPAFELYQKEQNVIMDEQLKALQTYVESYDTLDDAAALGLMNAHLERDAKMVALRQKWLGEFQKVVPAKVAGRVLQIDRRLSMVHQIEFSSRIPLIR